MPARREFGRRRSLGWIAVGGLGARTRLGRPPVPQLTPTCVELCVNGAVCVTETLVGPASEQGLCKSESESKWIERMDSGLAGLLVPDYM